MSDEKLEAVMLHELLHVERRDNLAVDPPKGDYGFAVVLSSLHGSLTESCLEERERACDEEVLRLRQSPEAYLSGILKVVRACVEQRLVGTSSIGGSSLKRRMVHLLSTGPPSKLGVLERTS